MQFQPEGAALSGLGVDTDTAVHAHRDFTRERQANAGAFVVLAMKPLKHVEDTTLPLLWNANSIVLET